MDTTADEPLSPVSIAYTEEEYEMTYQQYFLHIAEKKIQAMESYVENRIREYQSEADKVRQDFKERFCVEEL
ncbi:hypothetical protein PROFUN_09871 [Planoprotostelium fungivorum]|uniref:Uncharacterized protein n=1 Tax=Planoprotostelium fungivorum TaxID=1890364 RepID=A0A2P6NGC4_9EUKA|nr:hypothetical protein PROFUN_09871 [Planoprotostelium fungivorum]